jgi:hypothetical protein
VLTFLGTKLTILSSKLTVLSLKLTFLSLKRTFLSSKRTFLSSKLTPVWCGRGVCLPPARAQPPHPVCCTLCVFMVGVTCRGGYSFL